MVIQVLNSCKEVVSQSKDVKIVFSNIPKLAEKVIYNNCIIKSILINQ